MAKCKIQILGEPGNYKEKEILLHFPDGRELVLPYRTTWGVKSTGDTFYFNFVRPLRKITGAKRFRTGKTYEAPDFFVRALLEDFAKEHPKAKQTKAILGFLVEEVIW